MEMEAGPQHANPMELVECDVHDDKDRLVARVSSTCMTLPGEKAEGR